MGYAVDPDFDNVGLALGMVRGLRAFGLTPDGVLTGVSIPVPWVAGENRAMCYATAGINRAQYGTDEVFHRRHYLHHRSAAVYALPQPVDVVAKGHRLKGCECGFWAYWGVKNTYRGALKVTGAIEGYGRTVVGTHGFRSARARIAALLLPAADYDDDDSWPEGFGDAVEAVPARYPGVPIYQRLSDLLAEFPPDAGITYTTRDELEGG